MAMSTRHGNILGNAVPHSHIMLSSEQHTCPRSLVWLWAVDSGILLFVTLAPSRWGILAKSRYSIAKQCFQRPFSLRGALPLSGGPSYGGKHRGSETAARRPLPMLKKRIIGVFPGSRAHDDAKMALRDNHALAVHDRFQ